MFPGLNALLECSDSSPPKNKFFLVSEKNNDGSFFIHHFLNLYFKGGFRICFIALAQSFAHYSSVAQKLGANLNAALGKGQLVYIDGLKLISHSLDAQTDENETDNGNPFYGIRNGDFTLQQLYKQVQKSFEGVQGPCLLLVDDLSILLSLGVTASKVHDFAHYCMVLMCYSSKKIYGCFVCLVACDSEDDDDSVLLWKQLCHMAHVEAHITSLSSGYCKDVHGQIVLTRREPNKLSTQGYTKTTSQYKIQDRMVTFFAPGTSKAVL
ncbi:elongator complex protein 6 [Nematostella vectensis]|uniref:elongator complex protein 6 n=1 Tax=Nematostella vectensis TaxID=45351 RepID=UPI0013902E05|nr:elongator complex protein 6 [Nematostella vectensis]